MTGCLHGRAGRLAAHDAGEYDGTPLIHATGPKLRTTSYYDVVNFARRLKVPGHYAWGYNDEVRLLTAMFIAAYNVIDRAKEAFARRGDGAQPGLYLQGLDR